MSGELTREWRESRGRSNGTRVVKLGEFALNVPESWQSHSLSSLCEHGRPLCYGVVQPGESCAQGVPLIRVQDMLDGGIAVGELRTIASKVDKDFQRSRVYGGEVLISLVGTIGRIAIVPDGLVANIARALGRVAPAAELVSHDWLSTWLSAGPAQDWLSSSAHEVERKTLNLGDLAELLVCVPPIDEQAAIVSRVELLLAATQRTHTTTVAIEASHR